MFNGKIPPTMTTRSWRRVQGIPGPGAPYDGMPQPALSRRTRRALARTARRASQDARIAARALPAASSEATKAAYLEVDAPAPTDPGFGTWTLKSLREEAQRKGIRVDGKRPSLCSKADLVKALTAGR